MKKITSIFVVGLFLVACSSDTSNRSVKDFFSAFLNGNETIFAFGSTELNTLLEKSDYENQPKIGVFLKSPVATIQNSLNINAPAYYAVEGPMKDKNPTAVYVFLEVKNADSLKTNLTKNGFDLVKKGTMDYLQDGDMSLGIENNLAIIIIKNGDYDGAKLLSESFSKAKGDISTGKVKSILAKKADIVLGISISSLYQTSNTDLEKLSKEKKEELKILLKESYIENLVHFKNGEVVFETKNHFSPSLTSRLFFTPSSSNVPILTKLGSGIPRFGLSINLDIKKMQDFINDFSSDGLESLGQELGGPFSFAMMATNNDLSQLFNGQFGVVMLGEPNEVDGMVPDFNFHVGLKEKGRAIGELGKSFLGNKFEKIEVNSNGISGFSSLEFATLGGLELPSGCEQFGKKSISGFLYLDGLDMSEFDLEGKEKLLELVKYVTFEYDVTGGRVVLKAKNGKENILKQSVKKIIEELENEISGLGF